MMDSPLWEPMLTDVVHDAVATDRFSLEHAVLSIDVRVVTPTA